VVLVVVSGLLPFNSGKTFFTLALAEYLRKSGYSVGVVKPVAAHSFWEQYEYFVESRGLGVLVGEDVVKYVRAGLIQDIDLQNPVDVMTAPHDLMKHPSLDSYLTSLTSLIDQAVLVRVSSLKQRNYYLVRENLERVGDHLANEIRGFASGLGRVDEVDRSWLYNKLVSKEIDSLIVESVSSVMSRHDVTLCESFSNALLPALGLRTLAKHVIVVTPSKALAYGPGKVTTYLNALNRLRSETSFLVMLFKPDTVLSIKPSTKYGEIIEAEEAGKLKNLILSGRT
jgi:predicted P-loop ATPase/GTPase